MTDQNQRFLQKFLTLYQELLAHDGYGSMTIDVRLINGREKEVILGCGREYRFRVRPSGLREVTAGPKVLILGADPPKRYDGPERRTSTKERRDAGEPRRTRSDPRPFRLERRTAGERRNGRGRRHDD